MASNNSSGVSILDLMCKDKHKGALEHKKARDDFNKEAKLWSIRCTNYNDMAKESNTKAIEARKDRDEYNAKVKEFKEKRNEVQTRAAALKEAGGEEYQKLRDEGNRYHEEMVSYSAKGQLAHAHMVQFFDDANVARKLAESAHKKSIECRKRANEEHEAYVNSLQSIKDLKDNPFAEIPVEYEKSEKDA